MDDQQTKQDDDAELCDAQNPWTGEWCARQLGHDGPHRGPVDGARVELSEGEQR